VVDAFLNLFGQDSYHIQRFISKEYEAKLIEILESEEFDVVQLETLYLSPYIQTIRKYSKAIVVMRSHNVEHEIWKRIMENTDRGLKKFYLDLLTKRLEKYEVDQLNAYDLMISMTERDQKFFQDLGMKIPSLVAPIGMDLGRYPEKQINNRPLEFCFIGSLDWMPNQEAVQWLLDDIWPRVIKHRPKAVLKIAGRNAPEWMLRIQSPGMTLIGEVEDARQFIEEHAILLVPLKSGGGMRVKILEGMAMKSLVITTSIGIEGIQAENEKEVFVADNPDRFADYMIHALDYPLQVVEMGEKAFHFIQSNYDVVEISKKVIDKYKQVIDSKVNI
jgi:glycosyltransferase involved in cell wall biosynthesis